jgi:hypothetical protein
MSWTYLKLKNEYMIKSDEFQLYQLLVDETGLLGLNLKLNYHLCEALSYVHGFCFVDYGTTGWKTIKEYFDKNYIKVDLNKIKSEIVKRKVKYIKNQPEDKFYDYIDEMFSDNINTKEVKLVTECYKIIKTLQPIKNYDLKLYFELVSKAINELKVKSIELDDIYNIDINKYIPKDMPSFIDELSEEDKKYFLDDLDKYIKECINENKDKTLEENIILGISRFIVLF